MSAPMEVLATVGLLALVVAAISFEIYRKDKREGGEAAFKGLVAIILLLVCGVAAYVVNWVFAHLYGLG